MPADVAARIRGMLAWRIKALAEAEAAIKDACRAMAGANEAPGSITWYTSAAEWARAEPRQPEMWQPYCSVVADLCARHGAEAVPAKVRGAQAKLPVTAIYK